MTRLLLLIAGAALCFAQGLPSKVDELVGAYQKSNKFMGTVLVARDGKVLHAKGYGCANLEHDVPNKPETKFRLGSITKQFVALAILQLEERGKLQVTDSICLYIGNCPEAWKPVTIHHLLSHTSGIWNFTNDPAYRNQWMLESPPAKTMERFRGKPLEFAPGEKMSYSNSGYILLALILEKASGTGYEEFLQKNIFEPAGMKDSGHDSHSPILKHRATGYWNERGEVRNSAYHDMTIPIGGGDLYSTALDLLRWDQALYSDKLAKPETLEKMFTPVRNNYGYGWMINKQFGRKLIAHGGGINGFSTAISRFPDEKALIVVLGNYMNAPAGPVARDVAAILFNEKYELPKSATP
ncbi:MAG: beta-lactamase family protein [Acidimicrobiia bacterium]|nr:beta-lactamase family protein [Acidimicrobiia bacterium]